MTGEPRNAATDAGRVLTERLIEDHASVVQLLSPAFELFIRRRSAPHMDGGVELLQQFAAMWSEQGVTEIVREPLAVRDDHLQLTRVSIDAPLGESPRLSLMEIDGDGLICVMVSYDDDQLEEAMAELEQRATTHLVESDDEG